MPEHEPKGSGISVDLYVIAFLDVLNQRSKFEKWDNDLLSGAPREAWIESLSQTVGIVNQLRKLMGSTATAFSSPTTDTSGITDTLPADAQAELESALKGDLRTHFFADTMVAYAPLLVGANRIPSAKNITGILTNAAITMLQGMASGYAIRGSVEIGAGCNRFKGEVYGPCMAHAYHLESEVAQWPRIVVGPKLAGYIQSAQDATPTSPGMIAAAEAIDKLKPIIAQDEDSTMILDYLQATVGHPLGAKFKEFAQDADTFVQEQYALAKSRSDQKLSIRYSMVNKYYEARRHLWTTPPTDATTGSNIGSE